MNTSHQEGNKLFIVCPFCQLESFLTQHYGDIFFLTAPAAMYDFDTDNIQVLKEFISREHIKDVYIVGEISCILTKGVLAHSSQSRLPCEDGIKKLKSDDDSLESLTVKILMEESGKWRNEELLKKQINDGSLALHFLLSDKQANKILSLLIPGLS